MSQPTSPGDRCDGRSMLDADLEPRAPSQDRWDTLLEDERARLVEQLPIDVPPELLPPERDLHRAAKAGPRKALTRFFQLAGRDACVAGDMNVYYPDERRFAPDLFVVLDVDPRPRSRWVVSQEGRGLDVVIQVHCGGSRDRDFRIQVARFARLGIAEYFVFDVRRMSLVGFRLDRGGSGSYRPIAPSEGRYASRALGLTLSVELGELRFRCEGALLPEIEEAPPPGSTRRR